MANNNTCPNNIERVEKNELKWLLGRDNLGKALEEIDASLSRLTQILTTTNNKIEEETLVTKGEHMAGYCTINGMFVIAADIKIVVNNVNVRVTLGDNAIDHRRGKEMEGSSRDVNIYPLEQARNALLAVSDAKSLLNAFLLSDKRNRKNTLAFFTQLAKHMDDAHSCIINEPSGRDPQVPFMSNIDNGINFLHNLPNNLVVEFYLLNSIVYCGVYVIVEDSEPKSIIESISHTITKSSHGNLIPNLIEKRKKSSVSENSKKFPSNYTFIFKNKKYKLEKSYRLECVNGGDRPTNFQRVTTLIDKIRNFCNDWGFHTPNGNITGNGGLGKLGVFRLDI
jgi:hypothetical protein